MNSKKQYQRLFEGRQAFAKANTLVTNDALLEEPMVQAFPKMRTDAERKAALEPGAGVTGQEPELMDIEYYSDEINKLLTTLEDFHQDLGTDVEMKSQETGDYQYETAEKQISRYIMSSMKGLEDLQKYLERQKGKL